MTIDLGKILLWATLNNRPVHRPHKSSKNPNLLLNRWAIPPHLLRLLPLNNSLRRYHRPDLLSHNFPRQVVSLCDSFRESGLFHGEFFWLSRLFVSLSFPPNYY